MLSSLVIFFLMLSIAIFLFSENSIFSGGISSNELKSDFSRICAAESGADKTVVMDKLAESCFLKHQNEWESKNRRLIHILFIFGTISLIVSILFARRIGRVFSNYKKEADERKAELSSINKKLFLANDKLKHEISARRIVEFDLKQAIEASNEAIKTKNRFLVNMSHEIRTPMNGIIGMTDLALLTELTAEQRELLGTVKISADALLTTICDILDLSKMESHKLEIEKTKFNVKDMLIKTAEPIEKTALEKGVKLEKMIDVNIPEFILGDPVRVRQVAMNLLKNALKFTKEGTIELKVFLKDETKDKITIGFEISDTGVGIPEEKLEVIFNAFTQGDSTTTRNFGGTGLGLTISKFLVEIMGGTIDVKSSESKGTLVSFFLDFEKFDCCSDEKDEQMPHEKPVVRKKFGDSATKILLVDDESINIKLVTKFLKHHDCVIVAAENGKEAVEYYQKESFDLILMDIQMPVMNGYEATAKIREIERESSHYVPIVALTANAMKGDREKTISAGMDYYISKPINIAELYETIDRFI